MIRHRLLFKLRRLALPVVLLSFGLALIYTALNWMLIAKTGWIALDEEVVDLWLPGAFAWILVIVFIQPRLRYLKIHETRSNLPYLYHLAAIAVIAVPVIMAQKYIRAVTGDVAHVENGDLIGSSAPSKYYVSDFTCMHLDRPATKSFVSRRGNNPLSVNFYVLAPVCSTRGEGIEKRVWIASHYHQLIDDSASKSAANAAYAKFMRDSVNAFNALDPSQFRYLESIGLNRERRRYEKTLEEDGYHVTSPIISFRIRSRLSGTQANI